jgi:hypothetical protein
MHIFYQTGSANRARFFLLSITLFLFRLPQVLSRAFPASRERMDGHYFELSFLGLGFLSM